MKRAQGRTFLLVAGILYMLLGTIGAVGAVGGLSTAGFWDRIRIMSTAGGVSWSIYYTIMLIGAFFDISIGIIGILNRIHLEKAAFLRALGLISAVYVVLSAFLGAIVFAGVLGGIIALFTLLIGFVPPILYITGAQKNLMIYNKRRQMS